MPVTDYHWGPQVLYEHQHLFSFLKARLAALRDYQTAVASGRIWFALPDGPCVVLVSNIGVCLIAVIAITAAATHSIRRIAVAYAQQRLDLDLTKHFSRWRHSWFRRAEQIGERSSPGLRPGFEFRKVKNAHVCGR